MISHIFPIYLQELHKWMNDPLFLEFLQQFFPHVRSVAGPSSPGFRAICWATEEIGRALFAIHNHDEGFVRLGRASSETPRSSWSQLLHGQHTTTRLDAKLLHFILELFNFARPNRMITKYRSSTIFHRDGVFRGSWVLQHRDSAGASHCNATGVAAAGTTTCPDFPPILEETWIFLQVESPDGQDHLSTIERDVIIKIRVAQGSPSLQQELGSNDLPCLSRLIYDSEVQASIQNASSVGTVPLTRQNAMSFRSDNFMESDCASDTFSPPHLEQDYGSDEAEEGQEEQDYGSDEAEEGKEVPTLHSCSSNSERHSFDVNTKFDKVEAQQQTILAGTEQAKCSVNGLDTSGFDVLNKCFIDNPKVIITMDCGSDIPGFRTQVGFPPFLLPYEIIQWSCVCCCDLSLIDLELTITL
jgi:hypothetical protein